MLKSKIRIKYIDRLNNSELLSVQIAQNATRIEEFHKEISEVF